MFDITDWRIELRQAGVISCRPSFRTFLRRCGMLVLFGFFAAVAYGLYQGQPHQALPARLEFLTFLTLSFFGIIAPISLLWQRVDIRREPKRLIVDSFLWMPHSLAVPVANLRSLTILASELHRDRRSIMSGGWRWRVLLFGELGGMDFWVDYSREAPEGKLAPTRVADFVSLIQQLVPLQYQGPQIVPWQRGGTRYSLGTVRSETFTPTAHRGGTCRSVEEMPEELREQARRMAEQARRNGVSTAKEERIVIRDSQGRVRTYNSIDELPPDVRARFEAARRNSK